MTKTTESVERLMKRCQIGFGGRNAADDANNLLAECYGTLGALVQDRDALRARIDGASIVIYGRDCACASESGGIHEPLIGKRVALVPLDD